MARQSENFDAVLFDLDGVLTSTAALHARCWKTVFDELPLLEPFDIEHDYIAHVDGKPRYDGVRDFLASRGIALPDEQVREIGDRKQALVEQALAGESVEAFPGSVRWVRHLRAEASSQRSCPPAPTRPTCSAAPGSMVCSRRPSTGATSSNSI